MNPSRGADDARAHPSRAGMAGKIQSPDHSKVVPCGAQGGAGRGWQPPGAGHGPFKLQ